MIYYSLKELSEKVYENHKLGKKNSAQQYFEMYVNMGGKKTYKQLTDIYNAIRRYNVEEKRC